MANVYFRVSSSDIRKAVKERVTDPIVALTKNPEIRYKIAQRANDLVEPFVPKKSGDLRASFHVVQNGKSTYLAWGSPSVGKTSKYAKYQHDADDWNWNRHTPGTMSHWTELLERGEFLFDDLADYASEIMKKELRYDR